MLGAIAGAAIGVGGSILGQLMSNKAQKKSDAYLAQRRNDLAGKLNYSQNVDYLNTDAARNVLSRVRKNMDETNKSVQNSAIQGGATPEAVIATQGKLQDKYQDAVTDLAGQGEVIKQRDRFMYENLGANLDNQQQASLNQKIANAGQVGTNFNNASGAVLNAWANGAFAGKKPQKQLVSDYKFKPGTTATTEEMPEPEPMLNVQ